MAVENKMMSQSSSDYPDSSTVVYGPPADCSAWTSLARHIGCHPYITSFLDLNPHLYRADDVPRWWQTSNFLDSLNEGEIGLDSECVVQPILLSVLGASLCGQFFDFCQEQLMGQQVDQIFEGQFYGTVEELESLLPLTDSAVFILNSIMQQMQEPFTRLDILEGQEKLGVSGCQKVNNLLKWLARYAVKDDTVSAAVRDRVGWLFSGWLQDLESLKAKQSLSRTQASWWNLLQPWSNAEKSA